MELTEIVNNAIPLREGHETEDIKKRLSLMVDIKRCVEKKLEQRFIKGEAFKIGLRNISLRDCAFKKAEDKMRRAWLIEKVEEYISNQLENQFNAKEHEAVT